MENKTDKILETYNIKFNDSSDYNILEFIVSKNKMKYHFKLSLDENEPAFTGKVKFKENELNELCAKLFKSVPKYKKLTVKPHHVKYTEEEIYENSKEMLKKKFENGNYKAYYKYN